MGIFWCSLFKKFGLDGFCGFTKPSCMLQGKFRPAKMAVRWLRENVAGATEFS